MEPISFGTASTGLKMMWEGVKWIVRSRQAPWSAFNLSASVSGYIAPWYLVRFDFANDKPFAVEFLTARTVRPAKLPLRRNANNLSPQMIESSEATVVGGLSWAFAANAARAGPVERFIFVKLDKVHGRKAIDFELRLRLLNNRQDETSVWVRTNVIDLP